MQRRSFVTQNGPIGHTSPDTQLDDLVSILLDAVTLRNDTKRNKVRSVYNLVGEAYIHGLMNGEGLDKNPVTDIEIAMIAPSSRPSNTTSCIVGF